MAGSISLSLTQRLGKFGAPLSGGQLYFYQAGTVAAPQNAYQDYGLTIPHPNPIVLDAYGSIPQFYLADGFIKVVLLDENGVVQLTADNILVVGASSGSGGGGGVDPTTVLSTGDLKSAYGVALLSGFVRANGRTIGSATSGATERANADALALFVYLWSTDGSLVVSGGRTGSAAADFAANKTIALPDFRGRVMASFDDMGNSAAGRLTVAGGMNGTGIGAVGGAQTHTLTLGELPGGITSANTGSIALSVSTSGADIIRGALTAGNTGTPLFGGSTHGDITATGNLAIGAVPVTSNNTLGGAHAVVQPSIFVTTYLKL